jgi:hypothetical protein
MFSHTLKYVFFVNNGDPWNPRPETVVLVKALQIRSNSFNHIQSFTLHFGLGWPGSGEE